jgi:hypothetical protein
MGMADRQMGTVFRCRFFALSRVHGLYNQEDDERGDQEGDDLV